MGKKPAESAGVNLNKPEEGSRERPLRLLALDDWGLLNDVTLTEFDELRRRIARDGFEVSTTPYGQTIARACALLFALVESGGLCTSNPQRDIQRIELSTSAALKGYVRWAERRNKKGKQGSTVQGPRQHLYALGRLHLTAFIHFRVVKQNAHDGESLLPPLPSIAASPGVTRITAAQLRKTLNGELEWLDLHNTSGEMTWGRVFNKWLDHQVATIRGRTAQTSWRSIVELALWRLLRRERHPMFIAARRGRLLSAPLPDSQVDELIASSLNRRRIATEAEAPGNVDVVKLEAEHSQTDGTDREVGDQAEESLLVLDEPGAESTPSDPTDAADYTRIRKYLRTLHDDEVKTQTLIKGAAALARSTDLLCPADDELRHLLDWTATLLRGKVRVARSTAFTYASRVLRLLRALSPAAFRTRTTEDVAAFFEDYESPNALRGTRNSARQFDEYLIENDIAEKGRINWSSSKLLAYEQYRENALITEDEFERVRDRALDSTDAADGLRRYVLLTLLRRCGLRSAEAAWLRPADFIGVTQCRLRVPRSKTRAGRRTLPLYLLLALEELLRVREFVNKREEQSGELAYLFAVSSDKQAPPTPAKLARDVESALRRGKVEGQTAHGLRHAFASALFAGWCLRSRPVQRDGSTTWAQRALASFCRPDIEARAVTHAYHIQLLLGHADLQVTFDRYVHLVDVAVADAVLAAENSTDGYSTDTMTLSVAARIVGSDEKYVSEKIAARTRRRGKPTLAEVEKLAHDRLQKRSE